MTQESGRWHVEGEGVAQYLALSADGAWAERCRYASIRDHTRRLEERRHLWQMQIVEYDIADLSTWDRYVDCGLDPWLSVGAHTDAWGLARDLRAAGYRGVLSPSAALDAPGAVNLTLFGERIEHHVNGPMPAPEANPRPELYIQTLLITETGSPTTWAMQHTSYETGAHHEYAAWAAGAST